MPKAHLVQARPPEPPLHSPHAALLIDFDNVTLGIRSDLTKELKTLLSSDIIKGRLTIRRAYADWRRYPQYSTPLYEASIDMITAPAIGTNKKNATDIRLAIDAVELAFTRPDIGTFILLSGDSDFSTLVMKLKEYGKYVIGVGIRESASDLLIQNCDEYFSYSDLAGLTRETDTPSVQRDPWELAREAVGQMARNRDVMRSDRLKQVMQQIDSSFDERNAGFNRFSKFVVEAGNKGLLRVVKMDNGQFEVAPLDSPSAAAVAEPARETDRGGRGRGRSRGRGRGTAAASEPPPRKEAAEEAAPARMPTGLTLAAAFDLLRRALSELPSPVPHEALRNRMSALYGRPDPLLEPTRFFRLLRQVHDAELADVRQLGEDSYEIEPRASDMLLQSRPHRPEPTTPVFLAPEPEPVVVAAEPEPEPVAAPTATIDTGTRAGLRFRRGTKTASGPGTIPLIGVVSMDEEPTAEAQAKPSRKRTRQPAGDAEGAGSRRPARPRGRKKAEKPAE
ncbi:MAG TPA: NYN domain-containing protein [Gemmatimonadales bacterium]|nr:NYN domain-containing protein [Gemmatimonadales bacterium]